MGLPTTARQSPSFAARRASWYTHAHIGEDGRFSSRSLTIKEGAVVLRMKFAAESRRPSDTVERSERDSLDTEATTEDSDSGATASPKFTESDMLSSVLNPDDGANGAASDDAVNALINNQNTESDAEEVSCHRSEVGRIQYSTGRRASSSFVPVSSIFSSRSGASGIEQGRTDDDRDGAARSRLCRTG